MTPLQLPFYILLWFGQSKRLSGLEFHSAKYEEGKIRDLILPSSYFAECVCAYVCNATHHIDREIFVVKNFHGRRKKRKFNSRNEFYSASATTNRNTVNFRAEKASTLVEARFSRKPDKKVSKTLQYSRSFLGTYFKVCDDRSIDIDASVYRHSAYRP